jgi:ComF family protein
MVNRWLESAHGMLLAPRCILCGAAGQRPVLDLCGACEADLPHNRHACARCALPLPADAPTCGNCLTRSLCFDRCDAAFLYAFPIDLLVRKLKYNGVLPHARLLGTLLASHVLTRRAGQLMPGALVPVPLHEDRYRERGFNQAAELARAIGRVLEIPVDTGLCARARATQDQAELGAAQRRRNVRGAFSMADRRRPVNAHLAIVDDVLTTGSTVDELAGVLRAGGARTIEVWTVARVVAQR